jgi:primary-amine oxidase
MAEGQARIVLDEFAAGGDAAKADPRFIAACAKRGITDMDTVLVESWAAGHFGIAEEEGQRLAYGHCWVRNESGDNPYARPIANLHPVIDLRNMKILRIDDFGVVPLPPECTPIIATNKPATT